MGQLVFLTALFNIICMDYSRDILHGKSLVARDQTLLSLFV